MPFLLDSFHLRRSATSGNPNVMFRGCNHFNQHLTPLQRLLQVTSLRGGASASSCPTPAITRGRTAHVARDDFLEGRKMRGLLFENVDSKHPWRRLSNWLEDCCNVGFLTTTFQVGGWSLLNMVMSSSTWEISAATPCFWDAKWSTCFYVFVVCRSV